QECPFLIDSTYPKCLRRASATARLDDAANEAWDRLRQFLEPADLRIEKRTFQLAGKPAEKSTEANDEKEREETHRRLLRAHCEPGAHDHPSGDEQRAQDQGPAPAALKPPGNRNRDE